MRKIERQWLEILSSGPSTVGKMPSFPSWQRRLGGKGWIVVSGQFDLTVTATPKGLDALNAKPFWKRIFN